MKKIFLIVLILLYFSPAFAAEKIEAQVIKVTDGDTIEVLIDNKQETVRLLGVDCYETYPNNRAYKQAYTEKITVEKVVELGKLAKYYVQKELIMFKKSLSQMIWYTSNLKKTKGTLTDGFLLMYI